MDVSRLLLAAAAAVLVSCASTPAAPDGDSAVNGQQTPTDTEPVDMNLEPGERQAGGEPGPMLELLADELERSMEGLSDEKYPPYHLDYQVTETRERTISASFGALTSDDATERRYLDVGVRVGDYLLDNTHELRGEWGGDYHRSSPIPFPLDDQQAARTMLWRATDDLYKDAVERYIKVVANHGVKVRQSRAGGDFSKADSITHIDSLASLASDPKPWKERVRKLSAVFAEYPFIEDGSVQFREDIEIRYQVTTDGSKVRKVRHVAHIWWSAATTADDGMDLFLYESSDAFAVDDLPDTAKLEEQVRDMAEKLRALREAPRAEPYVGPAIVEGEAAGVLFHEALGHRVEGHRQADEDEGQTFFEKVGKPVLADFLDVYDDPRLRRAAGIDLMGHYWVDDQAVPAQRAPVVDKGIFKGFLMSRNPVEGFEHSNGHGRRQVGKHVVARQGVLVVHPHKTVSRSELKDRLIEEVKAQGKPYGLRFVRVQGGFTLTGRSLPQSFKVLPILVYRVYPDGREELVRGVTLEGTPLTALSELQAAADDIQVFNGICGAESGQVPVSSISPTLLVRRVETARAHKGSDRPPILAAPNEDSAPKQADGETP